METVVGIFASRQAAQQSLSLLHAAGVTDDEINLLAPHSTEPVNTTIPTTETEQPGMGKTMGTVVGGAIGAASGATLAAAATSLAIPGIGPVVAVGALAAVVLGLIGGAKVGEAMEGNIAVGLPRDELFVYEDALKQGRSILIVNASNDEQAQTVRQIFEQVGAESIDAARDNWWIGLRDAEAENYQVPERDFWRDEPLYRSGFEAALRFSLRGKPYQEAIPELRERYPETYAEDAFRRGYDRGQAYGRELTGRQAKVKVDSR